MRQLAARFDTSTGALQRHKAEHLSAAILKANDAAEAARGDNLLAKISHLEAAARRIAAKAEKSNDLRTAIVAIRELTRIVELFWVPWKTSRRPVLRWRHGYERLAGQELIRVRQAVQAGRPYTMASVDVRMPPSSRTAEPPPRFD